MLSAKREGNSLVRRRSVAYACVRACVCVKIVEQQAIRKTRRVVACYKQPW